MLLYSLKHIYKSNWKSQVEQEISKKYTNNTFGRNNKTRFLLFKRINRQTITIDVQNILAEVDSKILNRSWIVFAVMIRSSNTDLLTFLYDKQWKVAKQFSIYEMEADIAKAFWST